MRFSCESCGAQYVIADHKLGARGVKVRCKRCSFVNVVRPEGIEDDGALPESVDLAADLASGEDVGAAPDPAAAEQSAPAADEGLLMAEGKDQQLNYGATVVDPVVVGSTEDVLPSPGLDASMVRELSGIGEEAEPTIAGEVASEFDSPTELTDVPPTDVPATGPLAALSADPPPADVPATGPLAEPLPEPSADPGMMLGLDDPPTALGPAPVDPEAGAIADEIGSAFEAMFDPKGSADIAAAAPGDAEVLATAADPAPSADLAGEDDEPEWYVAINDAQRGPLTLGQLKDHWTQGELDGSSLCWCHGMSDWLPIDQVQALSDLNTMLVRPPSERPEEAAPPPPALSRPKSTVEASTAWKPSAGSALASLAAAELEPTGMTAAVDGGAKKDKALPGASSALEQLIGGDGKPSGSKFGAADQSSSSIRPLPQRAAAVSSLPLAPPAPPAHERKGWLVPVLVGAVVLLCGVAAWAFFGRQSPTQMAQLQPKPAPTAPTPAAATPPPAPVPAAAPAAAAPTPEPVKAAPAEQPKPKKTTKRTRSRSRRKASKPKSTPKPTPKPAPKKRSGPLTEDDLLPGGGAKDDVPAQLDESDILRTLRKNRGAVRECLNRQRASGSALEGVMKVKLTIQPSGRVKSVSVSPSKFRGSPVGGCIRVKAKAWRFPRFRGSSVPVDFPVRVTGG